jgi:hypothetical protein
MESIAGLDRTETPTTWASPPDMPWTHYLRHLCLPSFFFFFLCVQSVLFLFILPCRFIISDLFPRDTKEIYELRLDQPRFRLRLPRMSLPDFPLLFLLLFSAQRMFPTVCDWALRFFLSFSFPVLIPSQDLLPRLYSSSTPLPQLSSEFHPFFSLWLFPVLLSNVRIHTLGPVA